MEYFMKEKYLICILLDNENNLEIVILDFVAFIFLRISLTQNLQVH